MAGAAGASREVRGFLLVNPVSFTIYDLRFTRPVLPDALVIYHSSLVIRHS